MGKRFIDLPIGAKFIANGEEFLKTDDADTSQVPLKYKKPNSLKLSNNHRVVMGYKVEVKEI